MDRRQALKLLGASAAVAGLTPSQLAALLDSGHPAMRTRAAFTSEQRETVAAMAETIIPETDTPGAGEAGVAEFIEVIVSEWYAPDQQERFMRGLAHVDEHSTALFAVRFPYTGPERQTAILSELEAEGTALNAAATLAGGEMSPPFFHQFRSLVLHGFYTSEVGMAEELMFRKMPGRFHGCVDLETVTRPIPDEWPPARGQEAARG